MENGLWVLKISLPGFLVHFSFIRHKPTKNSEYVDNFMKVRPIFYQDILMSSLRTSSLILPPTPLSKVHR